MNIFFENWVSITGMLVVNIGLGISIWGAVKIYRADSPRNDWILDAVYLLSNVPTYGIIAPNNYSPQDEKEEKLKKIKGLKKEINDFNRKNKSGMKLIFIGFIIQFIGNIVWGMLYLYI